MANSYYTPRKPSVRGCSGGTARYHLDAMPDLLRSYQRLLDVVPASQAETALRREELRTLAVEIINAATHCGIIGQFLARMGDA